MPTFFPSRAPRRPRDRTSGLLFALGIDDLSLVVPTGQTLTVSRPSSRTVLDTKGRVATLAHSEPPWAGFYNSAEGLWEPALDVQGRATHLCLQSENVGATWSAIGTPTRTAAAKRCGDLVLDLLGDDAAGTLEGYAQVIGFTGNAVKGLALFVAAGSSSSSVVRLRDTTAGVNRLLATITWSAGAPVVTMTTGSHIATVACFGGVYRILLQAASVTAANTNQLEIYPATTAALVTTNTGTLYVGGVQAEDWAYPHAYRKATTGTVITNEDTVTAVVNMPVADFTVFVRFERPAWAGLTGAPSNPLVGHKTTATNGRWELYYDPSSQLVYANIASDVSATGASRAAPATSAIECCVQFEAVATAAKVRIDTGSGFGADSAPLAAPIASWDDLTLYIGSSTVNTSRADVGLRRVLVAPGLRTLSELRGVAV